MKNIKLNHIGRFILICCAFSFIALSILPVDGEKGRGVNNKNKQVAQTVKKVVTKKNAPISSGKKKVVVAKKAVQNNNSKSNDKGLKVIEDSEAEKLKTKIDEVRNVDVEMIRKEHVVTSVESLIDNSILEKYAMIVSENGVSLESVFARLVIAYGILAAYAIEGANKKDNQDVLSLQVDKNKLNQVLEFNKQLIVNAPSLSRSEILQVSSKFSDIVSILVEKINPNDDRVSNEINRIFHKFCNDFSPLFSTQKRENIKKNVYEMIKAMKAENNGQLHFDIKKNINMMLYKMMLTFLSCPEYITSEDSQKTRLLLALSSVLFKSTLMINGIDKNLKLKTLPKESFSYKKWAVGISVSLFVIGGMAYLTHLYQWHKVDDDAPAWRKSLATISGAFHKVWEGMEVVKNTATNKYDSLRAWITGKKAVASQQQPPIIQTQTSPDQNGQGGNTQMKTDDQSGQNTKTNINETQTNSDQNGQGGNTQVQADDQSGQAGNQVQTTNGQNVQGNGTQTQTSTDPSLQTNTNTTQTSTGQAAQKDSTQKKDDQTQIKQNVPEETDEYLQEYLNQKKQEGEASRDNKKQESPNESANELPSPQLGSVFDPLKYVFSLPLKFWESIGNKEKKD